MPDRNSWAYYAFGDRPGRVGTSSTNQAAKCRPVTGHGPGESEPTSGVAGPGNAALTEEALPEPAEPTEPETRPTVYATGGTVHHPQCSGSDRCAGQCMTGKSDEILAVLDNGYVLPARLRLKQCLLCGVPALSADATPDTE